MKVRARQTLRADGPLAHGPLVMATAKQYPETDCEFCGESFEIGYNAEYCSKECVHKSRGESVLNIIKHDHRFCFSCFTKIKEVERPTDEQLRQIEGQHSADAVIGFQYKEPEADIGEITAKADTIDTVVTGIVCGNCGTTDHRDSFQRDLSVKQAAKRLRERVKETREEGQHSFDFSTEAFVEAWNESGGDWEYALGVALEK